MNKKISISLVVLTLITVPLLKLKAAPTDLEDTKGPTAEQVEFLKDTKEAIKAMRILDAYRLLVGGSEYCLPGDYSCANRYQGKLMAESALSRGYRNRDMMRDRAGSFSDKSYVNDYIDAVRQFGVYPNPFDGEVRAALGQFKWEDRKMDFGTFKEMLKEQEMIIDAYLEKYYPSKRDL